MAKINTMGLTDTLNGKTINVTANKGRLTVDYRKENGSANITKVEGQEDFDVYISNPNGIIESTFEDEAKAYLEQKFETIQAMFNQTI